MTKDVFMVVGAGQISLAIARRIGFGKKTTHEGSGLANTPYKLQKAYPKAIVKDGLEITGSVAQNNPEEVQKQVSAFLKKK